MESAGASALSTRNPCMLASPRVKVGVGTVRFPGFRRRIIRARLVATGAFERWSFSAESKLGCEGGEGGVGAPACGGHRGKNALACINGFGATTLAVRAFKKKFSDIRGLIGKDHEDEDDEEEEGGHTSSRGSKCDDDEDTTTTTDDDDDEEDTTTTDDDDDEEDTTTTDDEEDTTEDECDD